MGLAGAIAIGAFWKDICNFLQKAMEKVRQIVRGVVMGAKIFAKKIWEGFQEISKTYSYDARNQQWEETIATRTVPASDVPADIRALVGSSEVDITNQLEMKLSA